MKLILEIMIIVMANFHGLSKNGTDLEEYRFFFLSYRFEPQTPKLDWGLVAGLSVGWMSLNFDLAACSLLPSEIRPVCQQEGQGQNVSSSCFYFESVSCA